MKRTLLLIFAMALSVCCFTGCSTKKLEEKYFGSLDPKAQEYFKDLCMTAIGACPDKIEFSYAFPQREVLSKRPVPEFSEVLNNPYVKRVDLIRVNGERFTDEMIHDVILEISKRDLIINVHFDGDNFRCYSVRGEEVVIDEATGKDGGAMHETIPYPLE